MTPQNLQEAMQPGIYENVPEEAYRALPYPSYSILKYFRDDSLCEKEIKHEIENRTQTDQMKLGDMVEAFVNGIDQYSNIMQLPPEIKKRSGLAYQELCRHNPDITYLPPSEYKKHEESLVEAKAMVESVEEHPIAKKLIAASKQQVCFVCDLEFIGISGELVTHRVKGRPDFWIPQQNIISDLKTTAFGGQRSIGKEIWKWGYDIQSSLYTDCMCKLTGGIDTKFYFIFVRSCAPYITTVYNGHNTADMSGYLLSLGRNWYQMALERYSECVKTGNWREYFSEDNPQSKVLDPILPGYAS